VKNVSFAKMFAALIVIIAVTAYLNANYSCTAAHADDRRFDAQLGD